MRNDDKPFDMARHIVKENMNISSSVETVAVECYSCTAGFRSTRRAKLHDLWVLNTSITAYYWCIFKYQLHSTVPRSYTGTTALDVREKQYFITCRNSLNEI